MSTAFTQNLPCSSNKVTRLSFTVKDLINGCSFLFLFLQTLHPPRPDTKIDVALAENYHGLHRQKSFVTLQHRFPSCS